MCPLCVWLLSLSIVFSKSSHIIAYTHRYIPSFSRLHNIPLCGQATLYPLSYWRAFGLFPSFSYCWSSCCEPLWNFNTTDNCTIHLGIACVPVHHTLKEEQFLSPPPQNQVSPLGAILPQWEIESHLGGGIGKSCCFISLVDPSCLALSTFECAQFCARRRSFLSPRSAKVYILKTFLYMHCVIFFA